MAETTQDSADGLGLPRDAAVPDGVHVDDSVFARGRLDLVQGDRETTCFRV